MIYHHIYIFIIQLSIVFIFHQFKIAGYESFVQLLADLTANVWKNQLYKTHESSKLAKFIFHAKLKLENTIHICSCLSFLPRETFFYFHFQKMFQILCFYSNFSVIMTLLILFTEQKNNNRLSAFFSTVKILFNQIFKSFYL